MTRVRSTLLAAVLMLSLQAAAARADRRTFLLTYTPYLEPAGESEVEWWLTTKIGKQDPAEGPAWESRAEWEYALTPHLTGAAYLNFQRAPGGPLKFASSSIELIYRPKDDGRVPGDPALYLEATETGGELELEPKLLLGHRFNRWMAASNLVGEFEFRHDDRELLADGTVHRNGVAGQLTAGLAYDLTKQFALGIEVRGRTEHPNFGRESAAMLSLGPCASLDLGRGRFSIGVLPQLRGFPRTTGRRNLIDFERMQVNAVVGIEL